MVPVHRLPRPFSDGRFALYTYGQETSLFHDLTVEASDPGDAAQDLVAPFVQPVYLTGWTKEEYEILDVPYERRGKRAARRLLPLLTKSKCSRDASVSL